jgi:hypothetical protein
LILGVLPRQTLFANAFHFVQIDRFTRILEAGLILDLLVFIVFFQCLPRTSGQLFVRIVFHFLLMQNADQLLVTFDELVEKLCVVQRALERFRLAQ